MEHVASEDQGYRASNEDTTNGIRRYTSTSDEENSPDCSAKLRSNTSGVNFKIVVMPPSEDESQPSTSQQQQPRWFTYNVPFCRSKCQNLYPEKLNEECETDKTSEEVESSSMTEDSPKQLSFADFRHLKVTLLVLICIICCLVLMAKNVKVQEEHQISVPRGTSIGYVISGLPFHDKIWLKLEGALLPPYYSNLSTHFMHVWVEHITTMEPIKNTSAIKEVNIIILKNISSTWKVPLVSENLIGVVPEVKQKHEFQLENFTIDPTINSIIRVKMQTNLKANLPVLLSYNLEPINMENGIIYAAFVLIALYILIIFEVVHRTLAAMLASTISLTILAALNARPTMEEIMSWIDAETLLLLFSMMTLVTVFSETGIFDYTAVLAYKLTGGKEWPLINFLCLITALLSCFLDNVTTGLLMTPVTIRLCEAMQMNPIPVLICMIVYSNIGGAITPIGDPPNVIIASNIDIIKAGVTFTTFTLHMGIGVLLASVIVYVQLRCMYKCMKDEIEKESPDVVELKREIGFWQKAAASISSYSKEEDNVKQSLKETTSKLMRRLSNKASCPTSPTSVYENHLEDLQKKYPIRNKVLLYKSGCVLVCVIIMFFLHSIPELSRLGLGWTALLGALTLLFLADRDDNDTIFSRVEWSTLLFFASLFILMEALARLGLIDWIGKQTQYLIMSVPQESRLAVAILLILWVSATASAFIDNIPLTTMMVRIVTVLADDIELKLPLQPLVWALSFGACFGGNGTLFGSSSNIVCAGIAEQHGYKFTFLQFMKFGFPIMITSLMVVTVYLLIAHAVLGWH